MGTAPGSGGARGGTMFETLGKELGAALRRARENRKLSLRDTARMSAGAFKPSTVASWERAERAVPITTLFRLTSLYGVSPIRLLADVVRRVEGRPAVQIDVRRVKSLEGAEAAILDGFIRNVFILRRQADADTISLRQGDLEVLATATGRRVDEFVSAVGAAFVDDRRPSPSA